MHPVPRAGGRSPPAGRRRWCSDACKQAAWRRARAPAAPAPPIPPGGRKRDTTIYECGNCGNRQLGTQRCNGCGTFMTAAGIGGLRPHCDEPVAIQELLADTTRNASPLDRPAVNDGTLRPEPEGGEQAGHKAPSVGRYAASGSR
jgi:hypothetical protein